MSTRFLRKQLGRRLVVHTKDDQSIRGVLTGVHVDVLVLESPEHLGAANPVEMEGRAVIPYSNFAWAQLLSGGH